MSDEKHTEEEWRAVFGSYLRMIKGMLEELIGCPSNCPVCGLPTFNDESCVCGWEAKA